MLRLLLPVLTAEGVYMASQFTLLTTADTMTSIPATEGVSKKRDKPTGGVTPDKDRHKLSQQAKLGLK